MPIAGRLGRAAVIAVSDGAGSARQSQRGSRVACAAAVATLTGHLGRNPAVASKAHLLRSALKKSIRSARRSVAQTARRMDGATGTVNVNEYACTLMVTVFTERLVGAAHIGDGCLVAGDGERWNLLSAPDNGEFANETKFLTDPRNLPRVTVVPACAINCLAVITDGLQDAALSQGSTPYDRFWTPLYRALKRGSGTSADGVLRSLLRKVSDAGKATDDCTIAACVRVD